MSERRDERDRVWGDLEPDSESTWSEKRRLARAMREVIDRLVTTDAPEGELRAAADALERYAKRLATHPRRRLPYGYAESANAGDVSAFFDYSPLMGLSNPLAPPIALHVDGRQVRGTVTFGSAYEGPPGHVHGGFVAAAFDEILGYVQSTTGNPGMTGTLKVRYRKPTPLHVELRLEGTVTRVDGRKIFTEGRMYAADMLTADAEGIFISVDLEKMLELIAADKRRQGSSDAR